MNDGQPPLSRLEHFIADLWSLLANKEHPVRAAIELQARNRKKRARVVELREKYRKLKRKYGIGG